MAETDLVRPFMLSKGAVRGRIARLNTVTATIIGRHHYPEVVSRLLSELLALAAILSSQLKGDGIVTIQLRGNGPVPLMVVDAVSGGELRGYADIAQSTADSLHGLAPDTPPKRLIGEESYLAITLDQGEAGKRYQGVVGLEADTLGAALEDYFVNSYQLQVHCHLAAEKHETGWVAGAMLIERLASEGGLAQTDAQSHEESWRYAQATAHTLKTTELLDSGLALDDILFRLFHEEGVEVFPETTLMVGCRCSRERMLAVLKSMSDDDKASMMVDGHIAVHCQFCNQEQHFTPDDIGLSIN